TTLHNRLDFRYAPADWVNAVISARNNLVFGELITSYPMLATTADRDPGLLDLSWKPGHGASYLMTTQLDRAFVEFSRNKWNLRLGRQRVNWGIGLVWNPNDLFNTFSYFDFDYEERPGSDAVKLEYFSSSTAAMQLVGKLDSAHQGTVALMYRFNRWNYDFQWLVGTTPTDLVIGAGWAGQVLKGGFRGEASWFKPRDGGRSQLVATLDGDYTLRDGWYFHGALLFNSAGTTGKAGAGLIMPESELSVKTLTRSRISLFAQAAYPLTPLISLGMAGILNPFDRSGFMGPSAEFSLADNASVMILAQVFEGQSGTEFGDYGKLGHIRLRWSF
ncbi:MAG TPA: hypothetical protein P5550_11965, partial [Bacteroidales bacterium]|nr:hypothetical protein [Bacteroidales bacterium]